MQNPWRKKPRYSLYHLFNSAIFPLGFFLLAGCSTSHLHESVAQITNTVHYSTLAHDVLREELKDDHKLPDCLALLDRLLAESVSDLDNLPTATNDSVRARQFFTTVDRVLVRNNFIFPPFDLDDLFSDALRPTNHLSGKAIRHALAWDDNARRRQQINFNRRRGGVFYFSDCKTSAMIYLAVAEVKKYPCFMVQFPGHIFVRWDTASFKTNWDANMGTSYSDAYYRAAGHFPAGLKCAPFLKSMTRQETLAMWYYVFGAYEEDHKSFATAAKVLEESCRLSPGDLDGLNARAWFLATCADASYRNAALAIQIMLPVIDCFPDPDYLDTLAAAYAESGDFTHALATENQALGSSETWKCSEYSSDPWPDFKKFVEAYSRHQTYAQYLAAANRSKQNSATPIKASPWSAQCRMQAK